MDRTVVEGINLDQLVSDFDDVSFDISIDDINPDEDVEMYAGAGPRDLDEDHDREYFAAAAAARRRARTRQFNRKALRAAEKLMSKPIRGYLKIALFPERTQNEHHWSSFRDDEDYLNALKRSAEEGMI